MVSLRLIAGALLLAWFSAPASAQPPGGTASRIFPRVREVNLTIEPSSEVISGTDVMLRCRAVVDGAQGLSREYTIYKGSAPIYTKTTSSSEDLLHPLTEVQISDKGRYWCKVDVQGVEVTSHITALLVRVATPQLQLDSTELTEGEVLTARCTAPGETGRFIFNLYDNSEYVLEKRVDTNDAEFNYTLMTAGNHTIHCSYEVIVQDVSTNSAESNKVTVLVTDLGISPVLEINPLGEIYEGDQLNLSCTYVTSLNHGDKIVLNLWHGSKPLSYGGNRIDYSMTVMAEDSREFECWLIMGTIHKSDKKLVSVMDLFSAPTLTVTPAEVFPEDPMTLTCRSESFAAERINKEDLTYSLEPAAEFMREQHVGVFHGFAPTFAFNSTCVAAARNIIKSSLPLMIRPNVHVSTPKMTVMERAVQGRPFRILCQSDVGSLPINYTLYQDLQPVDYFTVSRPEQQAIFTVTVSSSEEMQQFLCEAQNKKGIKNLSTKLNDTLIVPLSHPTLTVIPVESEVSEDDDLYLICGVKGSPPVTFKWYLVGIDEPLATNTSDKNTSHYLIKGLRTGQSGTYICEAINYANNVVRSAPVVITVRMALWKKVSIGASVSLLVVALIAVAVGFFASRRGKREGAAELSVKPSSPNSDDTLAETFTFNNEVHNADPENRAEVGVWSERPSRAASAVESRAMTAEPDVEYTEVVHPQPKDPARAPLRKGTDTVYSELQTSSHGAADLQGYESEEYVELSRSDPPESVSFRSDVTSAQDSSVPNIRTSSDYTSESV
ncbi:uncharacterized protein pecam1b isoform X2 [Synchiropus splendidus]|uniref:uncharacterized protein pecam1b isoform X2 n=1 Tax=Synchiropus splendidus TaxID=270530 RepID=UPI00237E04CD|nr:uncharacterized protein pecam1b isoform X2 [Synchiropus splendidus]